VQIERGGLLVDRTRLAHPGDLLHEAGHIAVVPADVRAELSGSVAAVPGFDGAGLEYAAVAWSYAAALEIGLDPVELFHADGYRGQGAGLVATFTAGVYPGAHLLLAAGMTAPGGFPHMLRWLRD
jgi:hypothetical protein